MKVLAIESSCDETAVAIVDCNRNILSHNILSQIQEHNIYGGVVPEIAARNHLLNIDSLISLTLQEAKISLNEIDAIAATAGPGLIGGLIVGVMTAKGIAAAINKPFIAVNHLEGHALTCRLTNDVNYPFLLLLVSGGHCQILFVEGLGKYRLLGSTIDDSVGEAFDKVAKMMNLGYPGGPIVEQLAKNGNNLRFDLPKPMVGRANFDFSFSGLKTAVKRIVDSFDNLLTEQDAADICASFQYIVGKILEDKITKAIEYCQLNNLITNNLVVAGGVAANIYLRSILSQVVQQFNMELITPPLPLCTDNAAMIGWVAIEKLLNGQTNDLDFEPKSNWPLTNLN